MKRKALLIIMLLAFGTTGAMKAQTSIPEGEPWTENFDEFPLAHNGDQHNYSTGNTGSDGKTYRVNVLLPTWDVYPPYNNNPESQTQVGVYVDYADAAFSGRVSVQFWNRDNANGTILILPEFTNINDLEFKFKASKAGTPGTLTIGYWINDHYTALHTVSNNDIHARGSSGNNATGSYAGPFTFENAPSGSKIALSYYYPNATTSTGGCINLDDFVIRNVNCTTPANLVTTEVGGASASFSWTGTGSVTYQYVCVPQGTTPDWSNATTTSNTFASVGALNLGTDYDFYVRKVCSIADELYSDGVMLSFTTAASFNTYTITVTANEPTWGIVTGGGTYNEDATATLTATPASKYYSFLNWTKNDVVVSTDATYTFSVAEDATYVANFENLCEAITVTENMPWTENFENLYHTSTTFSSDPWSNSSAYYVNERCWDVDGPYRFPALYFDTPVAFSGRGNLQFMNRGDIQILILPEFTNALNTLQFEFKGNYFNYNNEDNQGTLEIGYYDGNGFHAVCTSDKITTPRGLSGNNATGDYMGPYPLTGDIPSGSRMALRYTPKNPAIHTNSGVATGAINLDDFRVSITPSCPSPKNLEVSNVTSNSATFGWVENGDANAWQICLNGDETNLIFADSNPFTVTNLIPNTAYTAKVRAYCSDEDQSDWCNNIVSFETPCVAIVLSAEQPYSENFNSYSGSSSSTAPSGYPNDQLPDCWQFLNRSNTTSSYPQVFISSNNGYPVSGKCLFFKSSSSTPLYAILPQFEEDIANLQLTFTYRNESTTDSNGTLIVGYMTDPKNANTFTAVLTCSRTKTLAKKEVRFTDAPAGSYIAFKYQNGSSQNYYLSIDNVEVVPISTFTKTIEAVGNDNWDGENGGYYLIASPLAENVTPNADNGFIVDNYDLYMFDQAEENEWVNYKDNENGGGFSIVNGTGYLYASKEGTTLTFIGVPYSSDGEVTVTLSVAENTDNLGAVNLVGNPFAVDAYITKSFYTLENSDTYTVNTSSDAIQPMQGLLVVADEDGETLTFTPAEAPTGSKAKLNMNVSKDRSVVDQAIISFNEGQQLPKLQFRNGSTKVYIPQEGKDYAIVSAESSMGEMPVNFKAEENGSYTLSFTSEEVSFAYLHLIDNMTGIETDLLATLAGEDPQSPAPSYTFYAKTTDYESRFKLVFATGNNANDDNFAFFSNGSFVINNEGEATLQVIDINGRILKSESINGCANVNVKAAAGVYVLRLVNGNDVKVQKVVVR